MKPCCNDDTLMARAGKGLPILSLDHGKASENTYPYALHERYNVHHSLISSHGRSIKLSGNACPSIIGSSVGGNLAVGVIIMVFESAIPIGRRLDYHTEKSFASISGSRSEHW